MHSNRIAVMRRHPLDEQKLEGEQCIPVVLFVRSVRCSVLERIFFSRNNVHNMKQRAEKRSDRFLVVRDTNNKLAYVSRAMASFNVKK